METEGCDFQHVLPRQDPIVEDLRHLRLGWNECNSVPKPPYLKGFLTIAAQREKRDDARSQQAAVKGQQQKLGDRRGHG
jgi:hypothetical protein